MKKPASPFYGQIVKLVTPIVLQNLLSAAVSSSDVIMLNFVGQSAISAVSLAGQYAHILFMVFYGLGTGATMLCAQYFGKKDFRAIEVVQGIALRFSLIVALAFAVLALTVPEYMMLIFTDDQDLIQLGAKYIRILSVCYLCWGVTEVYISILRSVGRVAVGTVLNSVAVGLNLVLNAVFIFGWLGAPKMGVEGVALATSLSRLVELGLCFVVSARSKQVKLRLGAIFVNNKTLFRDFIRLSLPAMANDVVWGLAFSVYSVIIGHLGNDAVAANSLATVVRNFGTILCFGLASAGGILLGQKIGEGKLEEARADGRRLLWLTVAAGAVGGLIILAARPFVLMYAGSGDFTQTALGYLGVMLLINSYYVMGAAVNTTLIAGAFRAGGDSRFGLICDVIDMWVYAVPLGFLAAFVFKLPVLWVYFLLCTDEFVKWPWVIKHYRSGKWLKNITRENLFEDKGNAAE
ncbi:MATE family efflux transporter [Acutalibacter intestini]|uniref:MATE family efflux transporter n=1 Tax=Acutalibacter intestini TaxID=3093659 RepID=UPI002AC9B468|nr:MATE family efflux transporter [Acutalibacter sp. M00204]